MIQAAIWLEETIFEYVGNDSKSANYKTQARRITQALRTKEDVKQNLIRST